MDSEFKIIEPIPNNPVYGFNVALDGDPDKIARILKFFKSNYTHRTTIRFIKKNQDCLSYILRLLPISLIAELYREYKFMRNYWTDELLDYINEMSVCRFRLNAFNRDIYFDELFVMDEFVGLYRNYTNYVFQKRYTKVKEFFNKINLDHFYLGTDVVHLLTDNLANKRFEKNIFNAGEYTILTIYPKSDHRNINIDTDKEGDVCINHSKNLYFILIQNYVLIINHQSAESVGEIFYNTKENMVYDGDHIYSNFMGYQNTDQPAVLNKTVEICSFAPFKWKKFIIRNFMHIRRDDETNRCYVCKKLYDTEIILDTYNALCLTCAFFNYEKKVEKTDLRGKIAFITGIRHKIGLEMTLKLLRCGARVIGTTRFPNFAWYNYTQQEDYEEWKHRLTIYRCDFTSLSQVQRMIEYLKKEPIDIVINNACQTIRMTKMCLTNLIKLDKMIGNIGNIKNIELDSPTDIIAITTLIINLTFRIVGLI